MRCREELAHPPDDLGGYEPTLVGSQTREDTTDRWKLTPLKEGDESAKKPGS